MRKLCNSCALYHTREASVCDTLSYSYSDVMRGSVKRTLCLQRLVVVVVVVVVEAVQRLLAQEIVHWDSCSCEDEDDFVVVVSAAADRRADCESI